MERNIIEIRHGQNPPKAGDLEAYELGFCNGTEELYIGAPEKGIDPILINKKQEEPTKKCLPLDGGTMLGDINMGEKRIKNLASPTEAGDAVSKSFIETNALMMGNVTLIPENSDINNYTVPGCYAISNHTIAETCTNIPVKKAGRLYVYDAVGSSSTVDDSSIYVYRRQRFESVTNGEYPVYEREIKKEGSTTWQYYDWYPITLPNGSDYVVAQGTSGGWNYRKWNSGLCECYLGYAENVPSAGAGIKYGSFTLPFTMANNTYYVGITPTKTANNNYAHDFNVSSSSASEGRTTTAVSYTYYYSSSAIYTVAFTVYIMGRWK